MPELVVPNKIHDWTACIIYKTSTLQTPCNDIMFQPNPAPIDYRMTLQRERPSCYNKTDGHLVVRFPFSVAIRLIIVMTNCY